MEKKNINKMIFLMFLCIIVYNLAHPATPGLIELRNWKKKYFRRIPGSNEYGNVYFITVFRGIG